MEADALTALDLRPLRPIAGAAAALLRALANRPSLIRRSDIDFAGAGGTTAANAALTRAFLQAHGLVRVGSGVASELTASTSRLRSVADRLRGLADAAELDAGLPSVEAVVTLPTTTRLAATLAGRLDAHSTADGFAHVAAHAKDRLALLVPFGDAEGAALLAQMLATTSAPFRRVFVRPDSQGRRWYEPFRATFAASGGQLVEYWIPTLGGRAETFHAKIALADDDLAYVGSSNFMNASLSGGLECGVILRGDPVKPWSALIDALESLCARE